MRDTPKHGTVGRYYTLDSSSSIVRPSVLPTGGFLNKVQKVLDNGYMVMYTVSMIKHYPFQVSFRRRHLEPSPWMNNGKPYCDKEFTLMEFMTRDKAEQFIARKKANGTGAYLKLREGDFEVEEFYI